MTDPGSPADRLRAIVPRGRTKILDLFAAASRESITEAEVMIALYDLRRAGVLSFDGRDVRRPPRNSLDARYGPLARTVPGRDDQWFRAAFVQSPRT